ncbi:SAM-dependent methyltransferase [Coleofasciculus chthonoplastes]|uniref:SAM-dependent methyltransferase n=1 Tax=Coleofasciculus chthonoplastes TaxID=64178 RepID=UPI0032F9E2E2
MGFFDNLVQEFEKNPEIKTAFGEHIHWGYWQNPQDAVGNLVDFAQASEQLSLLVLEVADLQPRNTVLDAGCGWGGTIGLANKLYHDLELIGINIDAEQVQQAKVKHQSLHGNHLCFLEGDACSLPETLPTLDCAWALECIFAFPSRQKFFTQVNQRLKDGGKLIVVDFLIAEPIVKLWQFVETKILSQIITQSYGKKATSQVEFIGLKDYQDIANQTGYILTERKNITKNVQPTYRAIAPTIIRSLNDWIAVRGLEFFSQLNLITYELLIFEKVAK